MEKAIKKAVDGGYVPSNKSDAEMLLDPKFFQALGKSLGWEEHINFLGRQKILGTYGPEWRFYWHRFIDHLIAGKSADSFFEELLK